MKIQCDACERAEAAVLCCADEAALCWECDEKVHAANKLAGKHQRVPLLKPSSQIPNCDICQEKAGYFFCLEDRALLCRQCDVLIHTATPYRSSHQRFLVTGVKVALQHSDSSSSSNTSNSPVSNDYSAELDGQNRRGPIVTSGNVRAGPVSGLTLSSEQVRSGSFRPHWPLDEILASTEFEHCYGFSELASSQV